MTTQISDAMVERFAKAINDVCFRGSQGLRWENLDDGDMIYVDRVRQEARAVLETVFDEIVPKSISVLEAPVTLPEPAGLPHVGTGGTIDTNTDTKITVWCQQWTETERGWGQRPDGYSLHLTQNHSAEYIKKYLAKMPDGPTPDEYSFPDGDPYQTEMDISETDLVRMGNNRGMRVYSNDWPTPLNPTARIAWVKHNKSEKGK